MPRDFLAGHRYNFAVLYLWFGEWRMENYEMFALMVDCSRDAVMNVENVHSLILLLEKMGYDSLMLYTEDTYEVTGEPYFGYLRGRYSIEELREISVFGEEHHIEVIPCIQTLAHLNCIFKHEEYKPINDIDDILLVGEERTYELIENMFVSLEKAFLSRKVHIGMDEAHMLGLGKYKDKYGLKNRTDIFVEHLKKVYEIAIKHGFEPMMWSDMFFRLGSGGEYYDLNAKLDKKKLEGLPPVKQVYWDYYHKDVALYDKMIDLHREINDDVIFAGGVWTWVGYAPLLTYAEEVSKAAFEACRKKGVKKIIITAWGDDGAECSIFSSLSAIFFAREQALGVTDTVVIEKDFKKMFGYAYSDFKLLETPNILTHSSPKEALVNNPCKYFLFNDPLLGFFDNRVEFEDEAFYATHANALYEASKRVGEWGYLFTYLSSLCALLSKKLCLGVRLRSAYQNDDKKALAALLPLIEECLSSLDTFAIEFRARWRKENKPQGLEIGQIRLAGLKERLLETKRVVNEYLNHDERIAELEEKILPTYKNEQNEKEPICYNFYIGNATNSRF